LKEIFFKKIYEKKMLKNMFGKGDGQNKVFLDFGANMGGFAIKAAKNNYVV